MRKVGKYLMPMLCRHHNPLTRRRSRRVIGPEIYVSNLWPEILDRFNLSYLALFGMPSLCRLWRFAAYMREQRVSSTSLHVHVTLSSREFPRGPRNMGEETCPVCAVIRRCVEARYVRCRIMVECLKKDLRQYW